MPSLGADMEAGTLVEWLVKAGDRVKRGDVVAVVETQKGAIEIEIFEAGKIEQLQGAGRDAVGADSNRARRTARRCSGRSAAGSAGRPARGAAFGAGARCAVIAAARRARRRGARDRSFDGDRKRSGGGDHLCRCRAPFRRGRRSAGKEASAVA